MKKYIFSIVAILFTSVGTAVGQSQAPVPTVPVELQDDDEVSEIGYDEEIDNFDFLYTDSEGFNDDTFLVENLMKEAKKHLGARYRFGSKGPHTFDCSGFTSYVFKQSNLNIGSSSRDQYARNIPIKRSEMQPGDLVFFTSPRSGRNVGHVGIIIDYDPITQVFTFIHASTKDGVKISKSTDGNYSSRYIGVRRVQ